MFALKSLLKRYGKITSMAVSLLQFLCYFFPFYVVAFTPSVSYSGFGTLISSFGNFILLLFPLLVCIAQIVLIYMRLDTKFYRFLIHTASATLMIIIMLIISSQTSVPEGTGAGWGIGSILFILFGALEIGRAHV